MPVRGAKKAKSSKTKSRGGARASSAVGGTKSSAFGGLLLPKQTRTQIVSAPTAFKHIPSPPAQTLKEEFDIECARCTEIFDKHVKDCTKTHKGFEDTEFFHGPWTLWRNPLVPERSAVMSHPVQWKRAKDIAGENPVLLPPDFTNHGIDQGALGSGFLLSQMNALVFHPKLLRQLFVKHSIEQGIYALMFFVNGSWRSVIVDDYLPCTKHGHPLYSFNSDRSQLWVAILEKAYAKIHGCYQNIDGGIERYALYELTGAIHREIELSDPHTQALAASGKLWEVLDSSRKEGGMLSCATSTTQGKLEELNENGLLVGRTYKILDMAEVEGLKLLKMKNLYGNDSWTGRWSDKHFSWNDHPKLRDTLGYPPGTSDYFWMEYPDFVASWSTLSFDRIIDETWHKFTIYGYWDIGNTEAEDLCGGEDPASWHNNPQYFLWVKEAPTTVILALHQPSTKIYEGEDEYFTAIGGRICLSAVKGDPRIATRSASTTYLQIPASSERYVTSEVTLEPREDMPYTIVIYTREPRALLPYCLVVFTNRAASVESPSPSGMIMKNMEATPLSNTYSDIFHEWYYEGREHLLISPDAKANEQKKEPLSLAMARTRQPLVRLVRNKTQEEVKQVNGRKTVYRLPRFCNPNKGRYMSVWQEMCQRRVGLHIFGCADLNAHLKIYGSKRIPEEEHHCTANMCVAFPPGTWSTISVLDTLTNETTPYKATAQPLVATPTLGSLHDFVENVCHKRLDYILRIDVQIHENSWTEISTFEDLRECNGRPHLDLRLVYRVPVSPSNFRLVSKENLGGIFEWEITPETGNGFPINSFRFQFINVSKKGTPIVVSTPYGGTPGKVLMKINGLLANRLYECYIAAGNEVGCGPYCDTVVNIATSVMDQNLVRQWDAHSGYLKDNSVLYSGSRDWQIRSWTKEGQLIKKFEGHSGAVYAITLAGNLLFSASEDKTVRCWNSETGDCTAVMEGHRGPVLCLNYAAYSHTLYSGSSDCSVGVWNTQNFSLVRFIRLASSAYSISFAEPVIFVGMSNGKKFENVCTYALHGSTVSCVCPAGDMLYSGSFDCTVRCWDKQTGACKQSLKAHRGPIYTVLVDSVHIFTTSWDGTCAVFDKKSLACLHRFTLLSSGIHCMCTDGSKLFAGSADKKIHLLDIPDLSKPEDEIEEHPELAIVYMNGSLSAQPTPQTSSSTKIVSQEAQPSVSQAIEAQQGDMNDNSEMQGAVQPEQEASENPDNKTESV